MRELNLSLDNGALADQLKDAGINREPVEIVIDGEKLKMWVERCEVAPVNGEFSRLTFRLLELKPFKEQATTHSALLAGVTGDSWANAALIDRLTELGYLREVSGICALQDRIFAAGEKLK